jgi:L-lactate dehydrogenase complex protein LldG
MMGTIQNRTSFLENIAKKLGRSPMTKGVQRPSYQHTPQYEVLKTATQDELVSVLADQCSNIHVQFMETTADHLAEQVKTAVGAYGGGPVSIWKDERYAEYGLTDLVEKEWPHEQTFVHVWNADLKEENIRLSEKANVAIVFSEITLAESGTVVLFTGKNKGRSMILLPKHFIALIPKSTLVPRMTQAAQIIREKIKNGEAIPSCIQFVTGPSNSADIELSTVYGVHGPVKATYIVISDR